MCHLGKSVLKNMGILAGVIRVHMFDQDLRINVVRELTAKYADSRNVLLDFGCGTGDFSWALREEFQKLLLFDPCAEVLEQAKERFAGNDKAVATSEYSRLHSPGTRWDVILPITVLQHIMSDAELEETLSVLHRGMAQQGIFVVMEICSDGIQSSHERSWLYKTFSGFMERGGGVAAFRIRFLLPIG